MKRFILGVAAISTFFSGTISTALDEKMPMTVSGKRETYFYSTAALVLRGGEVISPDLTPSLVAAIEGQLRLPDTENCIRLYPQTIASNPPIERSSITEAAFSAESSLVGRVTGVSPGFRSTGFAGTLVRIAPVKIFKTASLRAETVYYFFLPQGDFDFGSRRFCAERASWAKVPQIGDEVVLFLPFDGWSDPPFLEVLDDGGYVLLPAGDAPVFPARYSSQADSLRSRSALLELVERSVRPKGSQK